jgi:ribonuclease Z
VCARRCARRLTRKTVEPRPRNMKPLSVTFLGTCSGGGPLLSRACSSTMLNIDHAQWCQSPSPGTYASTDCLQWLTVQRELKSNSSEQNSSPNIFQRSSSRTCMVRPHSFPLSPCCAHIHPVTTVDHVMGLIPLMRTVMNKDEPTSTVSPFRCRSTRYTSNSPKRLRMQIYGPSGLRKFVRVNLQLTLTELRGRYAVHELLGPSDEPSISCETDLLHLNENPGSDIRPDEQGLWKNVVSDNDWTVHAGPLQHRGAYSSTTFLFNTYC